MELPRYLEEPVRADLAEKMVFLAGPRQVGKTTLSKMLTYSYDYLNYDYPEHRLLIADRAWDRKKQLVILDELHKMKNWKSWLKGVYDVEGMPPNIIVRISGRRTSQKGETIYVTTDPESVHVFDTETGERLSD